MFYVVRKKNHQGSCFMIESTILIELLSDRWHQLLVYRRQTEAFLDFSTFR